MTYKTVIVILIYYRHKPIGRINIPNVIYAVAFRPQAFYTEWSTDAGRRILVPTFVDRGVTRGQRGGTPTAVILSFLDRSRYLFFQ
jgi:hypothetical protein